MTAHTVDRGILAAMCFANQRPVISEAMSGNTTAGSAVAVAKPTRQLLHRLQRRHELKFVEVNLGTNALV
jgi:hypothetical protein